MWNPQVVPPFGSPAALEVVRVNRALDALADGRDPDIAPDADCVLSELRLSFGGMPFWVVEDSHDPDAWYSSMPEPGTPPWRYLVSFLRWRARKGSRPLPHQGAPFGAREWEH